MRSLKYQSNSSKTLVHSLLLAVLLVVSLSSQLFSCQQQQRPERLETVIFSDGDLPLISVRVFGQTRSFLADTGSDVSIFDISMRDSLGKPVQTSATVNAEATVNCYDWPAQIFIERTPITSPRPVICMDLRELREASGHPIEGILGLDWMRTRTVDIDFPKGKLTFDSSTKLNGNDGIPLEVTDAGVFVRVQIPVIGSTALKLDTGFNGGILLAPSAFETLAKQGSVTNITTRKRGAATLTGIKTLRTGQLTDIRIGDHRHVNVKCQDIGMDVSLIGLDVLSSHRVVMDVAAKKLFLPDTRKLVEHAQMTNHGLSFAFRDGAIVIDSVEPNSLGTQAGLKSADRIVQIDGVSVAKRRLCGVRKQITECAQILQLTIDRNGAHKTILFNAR